MDLEKAYDSVWTEEIWQISKHYGILATIIELLRNWYSGINTCVRLDGIDGD